jgi:predicted aspartyl protease
MRHYFSSAKCRLAPLFWVLALSFHLEINGQQPKHNAPGRKSPQAARVVRFDRGNRALRIPIEIDNNIILLRVSVNNSEPLKFIFDTGASHTVINSQRAAELGLKTEGDATVTATGGKIQGSVIKGVSLKVAGAEISDQMIASIPFATPPGFEFAGTIGCDFIRQFVVEIDYERKIMNLYDPRAYAYSGKGEVIPLLRAEYRTPLVRTRLLIEGRAPVRAMLELDTGADGTFIINSPFVKRYRLLQSIPDMRRGVGVGAGGEQKLIVTTIKAVQLRRFVFKYPPVGLSLDTEGSGAAEDNDGLIGGEIFRRFKVILDYSRRRMILEPNKGFKDPYNIEKSGS